MCLLTGLLTGAAASPSALAQSQTAPYGSPLGPTDLGPPSAAPAKASSIVAEVDGRPIHLAEVGDAIRRLPGAGGDNSFESLFSPVLRRLIERQALVVRANAEGIAEIPEVRRRVQVATDQVLENEYLRHKIEPTISETALLARYDAQVKGKPGPVVVHAWAILTPTEDNALSVIGALAAGANFALLAHQFSTDSTAAAGGDLGFVRRGALSPELAAVVFSLRPGEVSAYPVRSAAGWFILKTESRGRTPTPSFAQARGFLLEEMIREQVHSVTQDVLNQAVIRVYSMAGKVSGQDGSSKP